MFILVSQVPRLFNVGLGWFASGPCCTKASNHVSFCTAKCKFARVNLRKKSTFVNNKITEFKEGSILAGPIGAKSAQEKNSKSCLPQNQLSASVYIHWPYCRRRCTYCNFNKYVESRVDHTRMVGSLLREWETLSRATEHRSSLLGIEAEDPGSDLLGDYKAKTIFFGGGTPSLMRITDVEEIIRNISEGNKQLEVTLEANPSDILLNAADFKTAGVNRLSLGVQSFTDSTLRLFNRDHDAATARQSLEACLQTFGGRRVSADLIFGAPDQTPEDWLQDLHYLIELGLEHISMYQLTVERGTLLHKQVERGEVLLLPEDSLADMYLEGLNLLEKNGLLRYEVSNFAKPGAECAHNITYWSGGEYIGLGPGSHSRVGQGGCREARINQPSPDRWMTSVQGQGHGIVSRLALDPLQTLGELLATGLRRTEGIRQEDWDRVAQGRYPFSRFVEFLSSRSSSRPGAAGRPDTLGADELAGVIWTPTRLWLSPTALNVADHVIPTVYCHLQTHLQTVVA